MTYRFRISNTYVFDIFVRKPKYFPTSKNISQSKGCVGANVDSFLDSSTEFDAR